MVIPNRSGRYGRSVANVGARMPSRTQNPNAGSRMPAAGSRMPGAGMTRAGFLRTAGVGAAALGAATMGFSGVARAQAGITLYVETWGNDTTGDGSPGNPYATIQKAVDMASYGATIYVGPGTFMGAKIRTKKVILIGSGTDPVTGTTVTTDTTPAHQPPPGAGGRRTCFWVIHEPGTSGNNASGTEISNFRIEAEEPDLTRPLAHSGVDIIAPIGPPPTPPVLTDVKVYNNIIISKLVSGYDGSTGTRRVTSPAIYMNRTDNCIISDNTLIGPRYALGVEQSNRCLIQRNTVQGMVFLFYTNNTVIGQTAGSTAPDGNTITSGNVQATYPNAYNAWEYQGVLLQRANNNQVRGNTITKNVAPQYFSWDAAVFLSAYATNNVIENNDILSNGPIGLAINWRAEANQIVGNSITSNGNCEMGILCEGNSNMLQSNTYPPIDLMYGADGKLRSVGALVIKGQSNTSSAEDFRRCNDLNGVYGWNVDIPNPNGLAAEHLGCILLIAGSGKPAPSGNTITGGQNINQTNMWLGPQNLPPGTDWCQQVMDLGTNNTVTLHKVCSNTHAYPVLEEVKARVSAHDLWKSQNEPPYGAPEDMSAYGYVWNEATQQWEWPQ